MRKFTFALEAVLDRREESERLKLQAFALQRRAYDDAVTGLKRLEERLYGRMTRGDHAELPIACLAQAVARAVLTRLKERQFARFRQREASLAQAALDDLCAQRAWEARPNT